MIADVISTIADHGVALRVAGGQLAASPPEAITPEVANLIRTNKPELLEHLAGRASTSLEGCDHQIRLPREKTVELLTHPIELQEGSAEVTVIQINELAPCGECGSFDLWQPIDGPFRCRKCDPPAVFSTTARCRLSR